MMQDAYFYLISNSVRQVHEAGNSSNLLQQCRRVSGNRCCHRNPLMAMNSVDREISAMIEKTINNTNLSSVLVHLQLLSAYQLSAT